MIEYLTMENAAELDDFVKGHPMGHYMQTTYYGASRPDYQWNALVLRDPEGRIIASAAVHSRASRFLGGRVFYVPRGPIFTTQEQFVQIIQALKQYCKKHYGYLLRIDPPIPAHDSQFRQQVQALGFHIDARDDYSAYQARCVYQTKLEERTEKSLLSSFHTKTRYNIRLAQRRGVTVRLGALSDLPIFHAMMQQTAKRDGFPCRPQEFYTNFFREMGDNVRLLLAEKNGHILAGTMEVIFGNTAWYAYGCSFTQGREDMPNYLLQWEMMRYALKQGCTLYDFRGVEGGPNPENPHYGLHRFKQGFDASFVEYMGQMDLTIRPFAAWLIRRGQAVTSAVERIRARISAFHAP